MNQSKRGDEREPSCIKLYVCLFQLNWTNPDPVQIVETIASRAGVFALSPPEMMKLREVGGESKMRGERASKWEDDGANLYLLPKWWPNVMELKKKQQQFSVKRRSVTSLLVAVPLVGVESTAGASRHPWLYTDWAYDLTWIREFFKASRMRQTSDSSWEFLNIENEQIKTAQNNSYGWKIAWNYWLIALDNGSSGWLCWSAHSATKNRKFCSHDLIHW